MRRDFRLNQCSRNEWSTPAGARIQQIHTITIPVATKASLLRLLLTKNVLRSAPWSPESPPKQPLSNPPRMSLSRPNWSFLNYGITSFDAKKINNNCKREFHRSDWNRIYSRLNIHECDAGPWFAKEHLLAPVWSIKKDPPSRCITKKPPLRGGFSWLFVGAPGFEPGTPWSQTRYTTGLCYTPNNVSSETERESEEKILINKSKPRAFFDFLWSARDSNTEPTA